MTSHRIDQLTEELRAVNHDYSRLMLELYSAPKPGTQAEIIENEWKWQELVERLAEARAAFLACERERKREREAS